MDAVMKRLNEREKQTILGLFTVFIIIILLASAFIGLFMSRNSASDAKDIKKAYESLSEVKRKPTKRIGKISLPPHEELYSLTKFFAHATQCTQNSR